ncbi:MAG: metallophosphoesterase family protein [Candidatus Omnitrophota bacterium]
MKIGVVSDTHIPVAAASLPKKMLDHFKGCDLIIHAGDMVEMSVIKELGKCAETKAVRGNMDDNEVRKNFPEKLIIDAGGKKIGVVHGKGPGDKVLQMAAAAFEGKLDIIIFGHSHSPLNEKKDGTLFFNPGSATDRVFAKYRSFGMIEIEGDDIRSEIIKCDD